MIWRSTLNILAALIRNFLQGKHQCILLEQAEDTGEWVWECSCGDWDAFSHTELIAIKGFSRHIEREKVNA
jgi:hypothetical protein